MGDAHIAQGDSEFDGTGIETSITGKFKITLHKKGSLPKIVRVGGSVFSRNSAVMQQTIKAQRSGLAWIY